MQTRGKLIFLLKINWIYCNTFLILISLSLTELLSQIFSVLSSEAETSRLESEDQETSEIPYTLRNTQNQDQNHNRVTFTLGSDQNQDSLTSLCPTMDFSNFPSYAPQIFISLSAAAQRRYRSYRSFTSRFTDFTSKPDSSVLTAPPYNSSVPECTMVSVASWFISYLKWLTIKLVNNQWSEDQSSCMSPANETSVSGCMSVGHGTDRNFRFNCHCSCWKLDDTVTFSVYFIDVPQQHN